MKALKLPHYPGAIQALAVSKVGQKSEAQLCIAIKQIFNSLISQQARLHILAVPWTLTPVFLFFGLSCRLNKLWVSSCHPKS
jgi:hypothetical protein